RWSSSSSARTRSRTEQTGVRHLFRAKWCLTPFFGKRCLTPLPDYAGGPAFAPAPRAPEPRSLRARQSRGGAPPRRRQRAPGGLPSAPAPRARERRGLRARKSRVGAATWRRRRAASGLRYAAVTDTLTEAATASTVGRQATSDRLPARSSTRAVQLSTQSPS